MKTITEMRLRPGLEFGRLRPHADDRILEVRELLVHDLELLALLVVWDTEDETDQY